MSSLDLNRHRIIAAADRLFYQQGYQHTSFNDIARQAEMSRGNFYYYFKSKDDILLSVIKRRRAQVSRMLEEWTQAEADPRARLHRFARMLCEQRDQLLHYGCPFGSMVLEFAKSEPALIPAARSLFEVFESWLMEQLAGLGHTEDARGIARHLLVLTQGVILVGNVVPDDQRMTEWAELLLNQSILAEGGQLEDPAGFVRHLNDLMLALTKKS